MILVTGSLAFDYIMSYSEQFKEHLLAENLNKLSISFLVHNLRKYRGGTAGNIAYSLKLLDASPLILATAGYDFQEYQDTLHVMGINTNHITVLTDEISASCFITTDVSGNQITMFHPGAMNKAAKKDLSPLKEEIQIAILAPEHPVTVMHYVHECQKHEIPYIFDPGQNIHMFSKEELAKAISEAKGMIVNDYEWSLFHEKTGDSKQDILKCVEFLIITHGEKGSTFITKDEHIPIPVFSPNEVKDPTGCGDAFRAGLLKGLSLGLSLEECGKTASLAATYCVEEFGTQNQQYTWEEFNERMK